MAMYVSLAVSVPMPMLMSTSTDTSTTPSFISVCPPAKELEQIKESILCYHCGKSFKNKGCLHLHLVKTHGQLSNESDIRLLRGRTQSFNKEIGPPKRYFCPIDMCKYNSGQTAKFFTRLPALTEHYRKVHVARTLVCSKCNNAWFSLAKSLKYHEKSCGGGRGGGGGGEGGGRRADGIEMKRLNRTERAKKSDQGEGVEQVKERTESRGIDIAVLQPVIIVKPIIIISEDTVKSIRQESIIGKKPKLMPKIAKKVDAATQTSEKLQSSRSVQIQCDVEPIRAWFGRVTDTDQARSDQSMTTDQSVVAPGHSMVHPDQSVTGPDQSMACPDQSMVRPDQSISHPDQSISRPDQSILDTDHSLSHPRGQSWSDLYDHSTYPMPCYQSDGTTSDRDHMDSAVQNESVGYNDIFCQTCLIPTADASVSADFRVSTTTSGQQCQLPFFPPSGYQDQQFGYEQYSTMEDCNWTNNETQTDIAMIEFDDLFADVAWNDMETQT